MGIVNQLILYQITFVSHLEDCLGPQSGALTMTWIPDTTLTLIRRHREKFEKIE
jgi:hypothetical protein